MQYSTNEGAQGICPTGWHIPTDNDWKTLEMFLGMSWSEAEGFGRWRGFDEGGKLKEVGTTHWNTPNTGANDISGFSALPGGQINGYGYFYDINYYGHWHTSTNYGTDAYRRSLGYDIGLIGRTSTWKVCGYSVRCVKD